MSAILRVKKFIPYGLSFLSGCLLFLSFPRFGYHLLAWFAFVPLFFAIDKQSPAKAFSLGFISGLTYFLVTLSWMTFSMETYGGLHWILSFFVMFLFVSYLAVYVGLFAALIQYCSNGQEKNLLLFVPALWVFLEFIKGHFLTGFPWGSLAYSQYQWLPMVQIADFGSIYSVGFVIMLVNLALYLTFRQGIYSRFNLQKLEWKPFLVGFSVFFATFFYGMFRLSEPMQEAQQLTVSVIQGNISQDEKWDRAFQDQTIETYQQLSLLVFQQNSSPPPALIVWPEAAVPFIFDTEPEYEAVFHDFVRDKKTSLLFGAPSIKTDSSRKIRLFNSAYLMSPGKSSEAQYDKMHLVPFGEYVPFANLLFFVNKLVEGVGDYVPGDVATVFKVGTAKVGTVICFEVIFPEVVREFVKNGATLMTTITNDAWFGRSAAAYQHFSMVTFRAIENRVPFARAANTGISGFIDADGRVIKQTDLFVETTATESLMLRNKTTLYTRFGDFFAGLCGMIALLNLLITFNNLLITFNKRRQNDAF